MSRWHWAMSVLFADYQTSNNALGFLFDPKYSVFKIFLDSIPLTQFQCKDVRFDGRIVPTQHRSSTLPITKERKR
jgi:hypothetical protein